MPMSTMYFGWVRVPAQNSIQVTGVSIPSGVAFSVEANNNTPGFDQPVRGDWYKVLNLDITAPGGQGLAVFDDNGGVGQGTWDIAVFSDIVLDGQVLGQAGTIIEDPATHTYGVAKIATTVEPIFESLPGYYSGTYFGTVGDVLNRIQALYKNSYHLLKPAEYRVLAVNELIDLIDRRLFPCDGSVNPMTSTPQSGSVVCIESKFEEASIGSESALLDLFLQIRDTYPIVAQINSATSSGVLSEACTMLDLIVNTSGNGLVAVLADNGAFHRDDGKGLVDVIMADPAPDFDTTPINPLYLAAQSAASSAQSYIQVAQADITDWTIVRQNLMSALDACFTALEKAERIVLWVRSFKALFNYVYNGQTAPNYYRVKWSGTSWVSDENGPYFQIPYIETPTPYSSVASSVVAVIFEVYAPSVMVTSVEVADYSMMPIEPLVLKTNITDTISAIPHLMDLRAKTTVLPGCRVPA